MKIRIDLFVARLTRTGATVSRALSAFLFGPARAYHPGKHYMRGPGPKWREKHGIGIIHDELRN